MDASTRLYPFADVWIAFCARTARLLVLNETGRFIWETHGRTANRDATAAALSRAYGIAQTHARQDVDHMLSVWQEAIDAPPQPVVDRPPAAPAGEARAIFLDGPTEVHHYRLSRRVFAISFDDTRLADVFQAIIGHLELNWDAPPHGRIALRRTMDGYEVAFDGHCYTAGTLDGAIERLLFELVEDAYRSREFQAVLHAGAVLNGEQAVIFAGTRGSGKSTLVAALAAAGMGYLSDDVCPLEADTGRLAPVPAPQAIKPGGLEVLASRDPRLSQVSMYRRFGRRVCYLPQGPPAVNVWECAWPVQALVFPSYRAETTPTFCTLTPLERIALLARSGSLLGSDDIGGFLAFVERTPGFSIAYADLIQAFDLLHQALGQLAGIRITAGTRATI